MKNGRAAIKGACSICGSGQFRIGQLWKEPLLKESGDGKICQIYTLDVRDFPPYNLTHMYG
jgi:hypothetical protein